MSTADLAERSLPARAAACPDVDLFLSADWDFPVSPRRVGDVHPYPARFIPELPALALDCLRPNGPVLDPFCGSGTTLVEAMRRGQQAVGVDLNPIAVPDVSCENDEMEPLRRGRGRKARARRPLLMRHLVTSPSSKNSLWAYRGWITGSNRGLRGCLRAQ